MTGVSNCSKVNVPSEVVIRGYLTVDGGDVDLERRVDCIAYRTLGEGESGGLRENSKGKE